MGKLWTRDQASLVLRLYCSRSINLSNQMVFRLLHMDPNRYSDSVKRYILFSFYSSSPVSCLIFLCRRLWRHSQANKNVDLKKKKKSSKRFSVDFSKEINTSHQCSRERPGFPLPQALSVFLINCQLLPLLPSHPDPQLPPFSVPLRLLRHPAAQLPLQPAGEGTRYFTAH